MSEYPYGTSGLCSNYEHKPIKNAEDVYPTTNQYTATEVILYTGFGSSMEIDNRYQLQPLKAMLEQSGVSVTVIPCNYVQGEKLRLSNEMLEQMKNNPNTRYILGGFSAGGAVVGYIREQIMNSDIGIDTEQVAKYLLMSPDKSVYYVTETETYNVDINFADPKNDPNDIALRVDENGTIEDKILVRDLLNSEFSGPDYSVDTLENIESNPDHFLLSVSYGVARYVTNWIIGR